MGQPVEVALGALSIGATADLITAAGNPLAVVLANQDLYLSVSINGYPTRQTPRFALRGSALYAENRTLAALGIVSPDSSMGATDLVALSSIPGLKYRLFHDRQALELTVPAYGLRGGTYSGRKTELRQAQASFGSTLNYDIFGLQGEQDSGSRTLRNRSLASFLDYRLFGRLGTFNQTGVGRTAWTSGAGAGSEDEVVRLDSTWLFSDEARLISYRAGDFISGGLPWTRTVRMGGIQVQRNFQLQPDLVVFPVPLVSGSAAVPSTVDVYVNNIRQLSQPVAPGPYQIQDVPVVTGQGSVRVVARDALGREQVTTQSFYASSNLLRAGFWDYSVDAGYLRSQYGIESGEYDSRLAGSTSLRYGLNDRLTLEGHAAGSSDLLNIGLGSVWGLGRIGVVSASLLSGQSNGRDGFRYRAGYEFNSPAFGIFMSSERTDSQFVELASLSGAANLRRLDQVSLSFPIPNAGYLSLGYVGLDTHGNQDGLNRNRPCTGNISSCLQTVDLEPQIGSEVGNISYSHQFLRNWNLFVSAFKDFASNGSDGYSAGLSYYLGKRTNAFAGTDGGSSGTTTRLGITQSTPVEGSGVGWRANVSQGEQDRYGAGAGYRGRYATVEADVDRFDDYSQASVSVRGSLVAMAGHVFAANSIYDSFAVVDTQVPSVEVLHENRPVGRSNDAAKLLIPNLSAYDTNRLQIDPTELPVDVEIGKIEEIALPVEKSGVLVQFPVKQVNAANVQLVLADGKNAPIGADVHLNGVKAPNVVGYDGLVYLRDMKQNNEIELSWMNGGCKARVAYQKIPGTIPSLGPVTCD